MPSLVKRGRWLFPIFLLALFIHSDVLQYWFVASDTLPLIETSRATNLSEFIGIFTQPLMYGSDFTDTALFYRPIASLSYAADYALWGLNPFGYHLTNLVFHAVAVALVAIAITSLTNRPAVGFLTAILVALHPVTVEVVPVTARRQDILLTIFSLASLTFFVRWCREMDYTYGTDSTWNPHWLLGGALLAYALALGSKETAVVVVGLISVWVFLQNGVDQPRQTLRIFVGTVGPFVAVTVLYLVLRIAVLGGLGGYDSGSDSSSVSSHLITEVFLFIVKYVLWLTYPLNFIEEQIAMLSVDSSLLILLVPIVLLSGGLVLMRLVQRGYFRRRRFQRLRLFSSIASIIGFATIPLVLTGASLGPLALPTTSEILKSYLIGLLFVGASIGGIVTTILMEDSPFDKTMQQQLLFFSSWIVLPLGLLNTSGFVISKPLEFGFGIRNGYFAAIPTMTLFSLLLLPPLRKTSEVVRRILLQENHKISRGVINSDIGRAAAIVLLIVPLIAVSPIFHSSSEWQAAGELNEKSLFELQSGLENTPAERTVYIANFPNEFDEQQRPYPHAHSVTPLRPYSIEAWLKLQGKTNDAQVRLVRKKTVSEVPTEISVRTEKRNGWIVVWMRTSGTFIAK